MSCKAHSVHGCRFVTLHEICIRHLHTITWKRFILLVYCSFHLTKNIDAFFFNVLQFQDKSLTVTHNLTVFGGCGLVLSIITGLFGINVDGMPGAQSTPYAFGLFAGLLFFLGLVLIVFGLIYLGLKKPIKEEDVEVRKLELEKLVKKFQHEAETHAQVHKPVSRHNLPPTAGDKFLDEAEYLLIN